MSQTKLSRRQFLAAGGAVAACVCCPCSGARGAVAAAPAADLQPSLVSACGIYCGACLALSASLKAAKNHGEIKCLGCWNQQHPSAYAPKCAVRKCAQAKHVQSCGECKDYPCPLIAPLFNDKPKYGLREKTLNAVHAQGLAPWLAGQKQRWTCAKCGQSFGYGDKQCPACGGKVLTDAEEFAEFKKFKAPRA